MKSEHIIEPELRQTLPRRIKHKGGLLGALKPFWWVLLPHTWVAVAVPPMFAWNFLTHCFPDVKTEGTVTRHYISVSRKGNQSRHVAYSFTANGRKYKNDECVGTNIYNAVEEGELTVSVAASRNPLNGDYVAHIPDPVADGSQAVFGLLWCSIWCGVVGAIAWSSCGPFLRSGWLVRYGIPVAGSITGTRMKTGSKGAHIPTVDFAYEAKVDDGGLPRRQACVNEMRITKEQYNEAYEGVTVTVLYDAKKPKCSIIYKYANHQACS